MNVNNINERTPRKSILIPLAESLNINHKDFKNRKLLIQEIRRVCPPSLRCENKEDFITLCPIDEIPKNQLFIWTQNKKTYGADIISLYNYIQSGKTLNPWTIDYASGIDDAKNRDLYLKKFDMKYQKDLIDNITSFYHSVVKQNSDINISYETNTESSNVNRFILEDFADKTNTYASHIISGLENCPFYIFSIIISNSLKDSINYFIINNDHNSCNILHDLLIQNELNKFIIVEKDNLDLLVNMFTYINNQKDIIYSIGVIQYILMKIDEYCIFFNLY